MKNLLFIVFSIAVLAIGVPTTVSAAECEGSQDRYCIPYVNGSGPIQTACLIEGGEGPCCSEPTQQ